MRKKYVLGVDGGNTKTLFLLYDEYGNFVDKILTGSCSHEVMQKSYEGSKKELSQNINKLLNKNNINIDDLIFSVFGLAGADFDFQKDSLTRIIKEIGFKNFLVDNDGYLALKAGSDNGCGVCNINGTGTVTVGINKGNRLQIGGIGQISGDNAGGVHIALCGINAAYNYLFRCGKKTVLKEMLFDNFSIKNDEEFAFKMVTASKETDNILKINKLMEQAEKGGDKIIIKILKDIGIELSKSVLGCIKKLKFDDFVNVVLAGSVWTKSSFTSIYESFCDYLNSQSLLKINITKLNYPPAMGAVIWALKQSGKSIKLEKNQMYLE